MKTNHLSQRYDYLNRDITALSIVILICLVLLLGRVIFLIYEQKVSELWAVLTLFAPLIAALLVARIATRQIANNDLSRADDRKRDMVRVTHNMIAITQDLESNVSYVKNILTTSNKPAFVLLEVANNIERRYESLLAPDIYKYLPGPGVDIICQMSGSIFGIRALAVGITKASNDQQIASINCISQNDKKNIVVQTDKLLIKISSLIDHLFVVRKTIDN